STMCSPPKSFPPTTTRSRLAHSPRQPTLRRGSPSTGSGHRSKRAEPRGSSVPPRRQPSPAPKTAHRLAEGVGDRTEPASRGTNTVAAGQTGDLPRGQFRRSLEYCATRKLVSHPQKRRTPPSQRAPGIILRFSAQSEQLAEYCRMTVDAT